MSLDEAYRQQELRDANTVRAATAKQQVNLNASLQGTMRYRDQLGQRLKCWVLIGGNPATMTRPIAAYRFEEEAKAAKALIEISGGAAYICDPVDLW